MLPRNTYLDSLAGMPEHASFPIDLIHLLNTHGMDPQVFLTELFTIIKAKQPILLSIEGFEHFANLLDLNPRFAPQYIDKIIEFFLGCGVPNIALQLTDLESKYQEYFSYRFKFLNQRYQCHLIFNIEYKEIVRPTQQQHLIASQQGGAGAPQASEIPWIYETVPVVSRVERQFNYLKEQNEHEKSTGRLEKKEVKKVKQQKRPRSEVTKQTEGLAGENPVPSKRRRVETATFAKPTDTVHPSLFDTVHPGFFDYPQPNTTLPSTLEAPFYYDPDTGEFIDREQKKSVRPLFEDPDSSFGNPHSFFPSYDDQAFPSFGMDDQNDFDEVLEW